MRQGRFRVHVVPLEGRGSQKVTQMSAGREEEVVHAVGERDCHRRCRRRWRGQAMRRRRCCHWDSHCRSNKPRDQMNRRMSLSRSKDCTELILVTEHSPAPHDTQPISLPPPIPGCSRCDVVLDLADCEARRHSPGMRSCISQLRVRRLDMEVEHVVLCGRLSGAETGPRWRCRCVSPRKTCSRRRRGGSERRHWGRRRRQRLIWRVGLHGEVGK